MTPDRAPPETWAAAPEVEAGQVDGGLILVHLHSDEVFELNRTGARLWEFCQQGLDRDQICDAMAMEFGVDRKELAGEVERLIGELVAAELLVPREKR